MTLFKTKCKGCGVQMHDDPLQLGYVNNFNLETTSYCQRCFQIKHYHAVTPIDITKHAVNDSWAKMRLDDACVYFIIDILDLPNSLNNLPNCEKLFLVINKLDLIDKLYYVLRIKQNIIKYLDERGIIYDGLLYTTSKSKTSLQKLEKHVTDTCKRHTKVYFVGHSNAGKSSLIAYFQKQFRQTHNVIVSQQLNTTLNLNQVKFKNYTIIDTPGFINDNSLMSLLDHTNSAKIFSLHSSIPRNFQINKNKTIFIENLIQVNLLSPTVGSFTLIGNDKMTLTSKKITLEHQHNLLNAIQYHAPVEYTKHEFNLPPGKHINIFITGLGVLVCHNITEIKIFLAKQISIFLLEEPIF